MIPPEKRKEAVLKRKETIARKKQQKEQKKTQNSIKRHSQHLTNLKDDRSKEAYAKVIQSLHKYKNKNIMDTGARYKGRDIVAINVKATLGREQILESVNKISKHIKYFKESFYFLNYYNDKKYYNCITWQK